MFVPDFEIACTCTPVERPCVMSKLLVTIWNSAIASRLKRGSPEPELSTFCLICWPSRFRLNDSFWPMPGEFVTLFAVTPFTSSDSSSQLRPCSGIASICRRSTLPATCVELRSTSGDSPFTVRLSSTPEIFIVSASDAFWPTSSSIRGTSVFENPASSASIL